MQLGHNIQHTLGTSKEEQALQNKMQKGNETQYILNVFLFHFVIVFSKWHTRKWKLNPTTLGNLKKIQAMQKKMQCGNEIQIQKLIQREWQRPQEIQCKMEVKNHQQQQHQLQTSWGKRMDIHRSSSVTILFVATIQQNFVTRFVRQITKTSLIQLKSWKSTHYNCFFLCSLNVFLCIIHCRD